MLAKWILQQKWKCHNKARWRTELFWLQLFNFPKTITVYWNLTFSNWWKARTLNILLLCESCHSHTNRPHSTDRFRIQWQLRSFNWTSQVFRLLHKSRVRLGRESLLKVRLGEFCTLWACFQNGLVFVTVLSLSVSWSGHVSSSLWSNVRALKVQIGEFRTSSLAWPKMGRWGKSSRM